MTLHESVNQIISQLSTSCFESKQKFLKNMARWLTCAIFVYWYVLNVAARTGTSTGSSFNSMVIFFFYYSWTEYRDGCLVTRCKYGVLGCVGDPDPQGSPSQIWSQICISGSGPASKWKVGSGSLSPYQNESAGFESASTRIRKTGTRSSADSKVFISYIINELRNG